MVLDDVSESMWDQNAPQQLAPTVCSCELTASCSHNDCPNEPMTCYVFCDCCYSWQHVCCANANVRGDDDEQPYLLPNLIKRKSTNEQTNKVSTKTWAACRMQGSPLTLTLTLTLTPTPTPTPTPTLTLTLTLTLTITLTLNRLGDNARCIIALVVARSIS
jgi:hypothetical protein